MPTKKKHHRSRRKRFEEGEGMEVEEAEGSEEEVNRADVVRRPKPARDPGQPTRMEEEEHSMSHLPYRSWCQHCVRGKARASAHRRGGDTGEREKLPTTRRQSCVC